MIFDNTNLFSDNQSVSVLTGSTTSTNVIDLGAPGTVLGAPAALVRDIGPGEPIPIIVEISTVFSTAQPGTLQVQVITSATATMASSTVIAQTDTIITSSKLVGYQIPISVLPDQIRQRYLALNYKTTNTNTLGALTAGIVLAVQKNTVAGA